MSMVANHLAEMYQTGLEYWTLNTCRSEISAFRNCGEPLITVKHPLVTNLMNGIGNLGPLKRRYNFTRGVTSLFRIKVSKPRPKFKNTLKLAMLPYLAAIKRGSDITHRISRHVTREICV